MNGELIVVDDVPGEFSERVVEAFLHRPGDGFSLVLSGGSTARRCYERLAADGADQVDWWQVDVYWGDERCVPPDDPDSNERLGREALLERVGAANAVYPMRCEEGPDPYQQRVAQAGRLDLVHLGLGPATARPTDRRARRHGRPARGRPARRRRRARGAWRHASPRRTR